MLLGGFDFVLIVLDYLSHFFEPLFANIQLRLPFLFDGSIFKLPQSPKRIPRTALAQLSFELEDLHAKHLNQITGINEPYKRAENALKEIHKKLQLKWPSSSIQLVSLGLLERRLNWINSDLRVASDLEPNQLVSDLKQATYNGKDDNFESSAIDGDESEVRKVNTGQSIRWKVLYKAPNDKTCLLYVSDFETNSPKKSDLFCLAKFCKFEEAHLEELRSSLVFRYTQLYPELEPLFLVVSSLLKAAKLIEAAGRMISLRDTSTPLDCENDEKHIRCWLSLFHKSTSTSEAPLSRYDLVLMLIAYLDSEEARQLKTTCEPDELLASLLVGFMAAYSVHEQDCKIKPNKKKQFVYTIRQANDNKSDRIELNCSQIDSRAAKLSPKVVIIDPVLDQQQESVSNTCWAEVFQVFGRIRTKLEEDLADSTKDASLLSPLFELCEMDEPERSDDDRNRSVDKWLETAKIHNKNNQSQPASTSASSEPLGWFKRSSSSRRKILVSFMYLLLFLVARNFIIKYLERWQRDLKHQARDDFIELKRHLFRDHLDHDQGVDFSNYLADSTDDDDQVNQRLKQGDSSERTTVASNEDPIWSNNQDHDQDKESQLPSEQDQLDRDQQAQLLEALMSAMMSRMFSSGNLKPEDLMGELLGGGGGDGQDAADKLRRISEMFSGAAGGGGGDDDSAAMMAQLLSQLGGEEDEQFDDDDDDLAEGKDYDFDLGEIKGSGDNHGHGDRQHVSDEL